MRLPFRIAVLAAGAFALSGCASIFGGKQTSLSDTQRLDIGNIYHEYASEQLHLGRSLMRAGAYASAIDPLRKASNDRELASTAYNAMGVAYAKLKRPDVASRHFQMALLLDPENEKFAGNLIRLRTDFPVGPHSERPGLAAALRAEAQGNAGFSAEDSIGTSVAVARPVKPVYGASVVAQSGGGGLQRISANEVRIGRAPAGGKDTASKLARSEYPIRVKLSAPAKFKKEPMPGSSTDYPVKIPF